MYYSEVLFCIIGHAVYTSIYCICIYSFEFETEEMVERRAALEGTIDSNVERICSALAICLLIAPSPAHERPPHLTERRPPARQPASHLHLTAFWHSAE